MPWLGVSKNSLQSWFRSQFILQANWRLEFQEAAILHWQAWRFSYHCFASCFWLFPCIFVFLLVMRCVKLLFMSGPARSKNSGLCSQPLICSPYQRPNEQLPVSSNVSADNFWLFFKKNMRIIKNNLLESN